MNHAAENRYGLFWEVMSGAMAVELLLEEIGLDYEIVAIDMAAGEHKSARFLSLNPTGQVPALRLPDGRVIGESAALILTLGERHPSALVPAAGEPDRPGFLRWLIYMATSPYMTFVQLNHPERFLDDAATHEALVNNARTRLLSQFSVLDEAVSGKPYFLARGLSALDLYLYMLIEFFPEKGDLWDTRPRLKALHGALADRETVRLVRSRHC